MSCGTTQSSPAPHRRALHRLRADCRPSRVINARALSVGKPPASLCSQLVLQGGATFPTLDAHRPVASRSAPCLATSLAFGACALATALSAASMYAPSSQSKLHCGYATSAPGSRPSASASRTRSAAQCHLTLGTHLQDARFPHGTVTHPGYMTRTQLTGTLLVTTPYTARSMVLTNVALSRSVHEGSLRTCAAPRYSLRRPCLAPYPRHPGQPQP